MSEPHNPERIRALEGCAELYKIAANHLESNPPNYKDAAKAIMTSIMTGQELHYTIMIDYVMTKKFQTEDLYRSFTNED